MKIRKFGVGGRMSECERRLSSCDLDFPRLILLPIPTTRDKKYINGTSTLLSDIPRVSGEGALVVGYNIPEETVKELRARECSVFDAALDEDFLLENARVTARGAVASLMSSSELDVSDMSVAVIGLGRIGTALLNLLLFLGAAVTVYTKRESVVKDLSSLEIDCRPIGRDSDLSEFDAVFNTAPESIIDNEKIAALPAKTRIIDLASGNIFEPSERLTKLSSIPDKMYPVSAGKLYAEAIIRAVKGGALH